MSRVAGWLERFTRHWEDRVPADGKGRAVGKSIQKLATLLDAALRPFDGRQQVA
jgi:hypothetical protein